MNNFAVLDINYLHFSTHILIRNTSNNPCHLTCYYTDKKPRRHKTSRNERGLTLPWGAYFCFVAWQTVEQLEPGDTLTHTFAVPDWSYCQTKWFAFRGTVASVLSPSVSALFKHHHLRRIYGTEEQALYDGAVFCLPTRPSIGQRLTITNREVGKLSFVLQRYGSGWAGNIFFTIRRVTDNSIILTKLWGLEASVPTTPTWLEVTFDYPAFINEEVRITADWDTPHYTRSNNLRFYTQSSDVKPSELYTRFEDNIWTEPWPWDAAYRYSYFE